MKRRRLVCAGMKLSCQPMTMEIEDTEQASLLIERLDEVIRDRIAQVPIGPLEMAWLMALTRSKELEHAH